MKPIKINQTEKLTIKQIFKAIYFSWIGGALVHIIPLILLGPESAVLSAFFAILLGFLIVPMIMVLWLPMRRFIGDHILACILFGAFIGFVYGLMLAELMDVNPTKTYRFIGIGIVSGLIYWKIVRDSLKHQHQWYETRFKQK